MRSPYPSALLVAALSSFLVAQEPTPAVDLKKLRSEASEAVQSGDYKAAAASFKKITEADPKDARAWQLLGYYLHVDGRLDEALPAHLKAAEFKQTAPIATYNVACVHALKGNADEAFAWLEKSIAAGFDNIDQLQGDEDFASIRKDPRFLKIAESVKAKAKSAPPTVFAQSVPRMNARAAWFGSGGSPGQISVDWSPVVWKEAYEKGFAAGKYKGQRWRLGSDFWTRLDTSLNLQCGSTAVPAGYYYLTLEQRGDNEFVLALHDPAAVRKQKLDAFQSARLQGGIEVAMRHTTTEKVADKLEIAVKMNEGSRTDGEIVIHFGGHVLATPFQAKVE